MTEITIWPLVTTAAVIGLVLAERNAHRSRLLLKPLASAGFILTALATGVSDTYGRWVLAGLMLSAVGDVALLGDGRPAFLAGLSAFLLAHVAYMLGFLHLGPSLPAVMIAGGVLTVAAVFVGRWLIPHVPHALRRPVIVYVVIISAMTTAAAGLASSQTVLIPAGAILFYLSDLAVARNRFVAPGWINRIWGLPTYYAGQVLLALSVQASV